MTRSAISPTSTKAWEKLVDFRNQEGQPNVTGHGARALVQQVVGGDKASEFVG